MRVSKLAKVLNALRKPDVEVSFKTFTKRHPKKSLRAVSEQYDSKMHRAFRSGRPFHEEGFARADPVSGLETVSSRFKEDLGGTTDHPEPKDYFPRGKLWVKPEFAYRFVKQGLVVKGNLFAKNREEAEFKLGEMGIDHTYLEPVEDVNNSHLQFLGRVFNPRNWENSSSQINRARAGILSGIALGVVAGGYLGSVFYKNAEVSGNKQGVVNVQNSVNSTPRKTEIPEVSKPEVKPQTHYFPATNVNVKLPIPSLPQTQQIYRATTSIPEVKTNKLERVVSVPSVPKTQKTNVVQRVESKPIATNQIVNVQYDLTPFGRIIVQKEPLLVYSNALARANEFPFVFSREYDPANVLVPTLVNQDGKVKRELDLSPIGIKATTSNGNFSIRGTRLITPNGFWCELDAKSLGDNQVYIFPRANGSFYTIDSKGASLKSDSNRNVSLTSANGVYSTKPLARREYLERRFNNKN